jgi:Deoxycytidine deaminase
VGLEHLPANLRQWRRGTNAVFPVRRAMSYNLSWSGWKVSRTNRSHTSKSL